MTVIVMMAMTIMMMVFLFHLNILSAVIVTQVRTEIFLLIVDNDECEEELSLSVLSYYRSSIYLQKLRKSARTPIGIDALQAEN
jgi:hypothetical protein